MLTQYVYGCTYRVRHSLLPCDQCTGVWGSMRTGSNHSCKPLENSQAQPLTPHRTREGQRSSLAPAGRASWPIGLVASILNSIPWVHPLLEMKRRQDYLINGNRNWNSLSEKPRWFYQNIRVTTCLSCPWLGWDLEVTPTLSASKLWNCFSQLEGSSSPKSPMSGNSPRIKVSFRHLSTLLCNNLILVHSSSWKTWN